MGKLYKEELKAIVTILEDPTPFATPEEAAQAIADALDDFRSKRLWFYGCYIVAGIPGCLGPFSTKNQAQKALEKHGADRGWVVPGRTPEGLERLLSALDEQPERKALKDLPDAGKGFWPKAFAIKDGEAAGIVAEMIKVVRLKDAS